MASRIVLRSLRNIGSLKRMPTTSQLFNAKVACPVISNQIKTYKVSSISNQSAYSNLTAFLNEEIKLEKNAQKLKNKLPTIAGFDAKADGPNITLTKTHNDENITIKFNVNHTIGDEAANEDVPEQEIKSDEPPAPMKSKPTFCVDIKRKDNTLSFWCSFLGTEMPESGEVEGEVQREDFQIDEFAIHNGEWNENVYSVDCSVVDGDLYDLLLQTLDERGIGEDFANNLMEFSTTYEHSLYIALLEKLKDFAK